METRPSGVAKEMRPCRSEIQFSINIHEDKLMHRPNLLDSSDCIPAPPAADRPVSPNCPVVMPEGMFCYFINSSEVTF